MISTTAARSIRHGIYLGRGVVIKEPGFIRQSLFERAFVRTRVRFSDRAHDFWTAEGLRGRISEERPSRLTASTVRVGCNDCGISRYASGPATAALWARHHGRTVHGRQEEAEDA